ncbi:hypothetical protein, conserved [Trypanosoma brucei gambiense DAL972]|uniref:Uncharacterized protein n=1 Tax=Trypanosoma brucei gambiense (strain MHOM/CI/86/DAL972) TaxID=679716 RepID=C9ZP99_TRYB9|nr:hypothetical protein, conserved [Trypanosoma brucei gambiense DAL972]CBH11227.1 hypothetical protein, conserved [Trypanosoma brucei gambiense DAL972]|eukprot:XP_011773514.1 hypothetical protein, conserved [Trypanosoma brucei gambiense DAL972]
MCHRLVLPLPPSFLCVPSVVEGYGVFDYSSGEGEVDVVYDFSSQLCSQHPQLRSYVDQLCEFLHKTRLIQYNPDDFFRLMPDDCDEGGDCCEALRHPDGRLVELEELQRMRRLCDSFATLMPSGTALFDVMNVLIRDGPPPAAADCLHSFYSETRLLMMNRKRRQQNDAARLTLCLPQETDRKEAEDAEGQQKQRQRTDRVMRALLGHGMGPKKQHEVRVMRDTVIDVISCCNRSLHPEECVRTVMNVGEGKGYVSRAFALCDGLQVVGLDCNPAHKERAVERVSHLLHGYLNVDASCPSMTGRDMINFLYEPRGHMATVVCTVKASVDWCAVLRGHVRLLKGGECCSHDSIVSIDEKALANPWELEEYGIVGDEPTEKRRGNGLSCLRGQLASATAKLQCLICGHILVRSAPTAIVRHARHHLQSDHTKASDTEAAPFPSRDVVNKWNCDLPVGAFVAKLIDAFFIEIKAERRNTPIAVKHSRSASENDDFNREESTEVEKRKSVSEQRVLYGEWTDVRLPRGTRAEVLAPIKGKQHQDQEVNNRGTCTTNGTTEDVVYSYAEICVTIVGYDCAHNQHFIIRDDGRRKEGITLLQHSQPIATPLDESPKRSVNTPAAETAWSEKVMFLLRIQPFPPTVAPAIRVPSLSNVLMMGLHTCGDLGSNICRLFVSGASPGLVLVSCCWHALTNDGFPLSREFQQRGWRVEMLSLMLATQPFDMWTTASPEGHRDSAALLFYRSLLKRLWVRLQGRWRQLTVNMSQPTSSCCCSLVDVPHLEPAFLRRMAKVKHSVTLDTLYMEACREYFSSDSDGKWEHMWHHTSCEQRVCHSCRAAQMKFLADEENIALASRMGREYFDKYFSPFLGLTILRMWMCHLVETLLLLDRTFYLTESLITEGRGGGSVVSLVPLFDGSISPRMYGILARRFPVAQ